MKYANEELLSDSSDDEYTFNTKESEGCKLIDVKYLSRATSNAHVCEKGEKIFWRLCRSLFSIMTYFPYHIPKFQFNPNPKSLRERLTGLVHL